MTSTVRMDLAKIAPSAPPHTTVNIPLAALGSQIFTLHVVAPQTIGIQGTLVFRSPASSVLITATGLRINPTNSFTPIRAFIP